MTDDTDGGDREHNASDPLHAPNPDIDELLRAVIKTPTVSTRMMDCGREACDACPHGPYLFVGGEYHGHAEFNDPPSYVVK